MKEREKLAKEVINLFAKENMTYLQAMSFLEYLQQCIRENSVIVSREGK